MVGMGDCFMWRKDNQHPQAQIKKAPGPIIIAWQHIFNTSMGLVSLVSLLPELRTIE